MTDEEFLAYLHRVTTRIAAGASAVDVVLDEIPEPVWKRLCELSQRNEVNHA